MRPPRSCPLLPYTTLFRSPPEVVWRHVVTFPELPPPTELMFRAGVAAPTRARIEGSGVGAVRYCDFTTGSFVEPIDRKSTRLNSSHLVISYAVFCLKKKIR